jgi:hypothetical protein
MVKLPTVGQPSIMSFVPSPLALASTSTSSLANTRQLKKGLGKYFIHHYSIAACFILQQ